MSGGTQGADTSAFQVRSGVENSGPAKYSFMPWSIGDANRDGGGPDGSIRQRRHTGPGERRDRRSDEMGSDARAGTRILGTLRSADGMGAVRVEDRLAADIDEVGPP